MKIFKQELLEKIKDFNQIYFLADDNSINGEKSWKNYLDPIAKHLYRMDYSAFIAKFQITQPCVPGGLEAYYNFFSKVVEDLESLISLDTASEVHKCAADVKLTFDRFLALNDYKINTTCYINDGVEYCWTNIFPLV